MSDLNVAKLRNGTSGTGGPRARRRESSPKNDVFLHVPMRLVTRNFIPQTRRTPIHRRKHDPR